MIDKNSKVEMNKLEKKNKLLSAAFSLFVEKGVKNTTIQDIVDRAGVAKGTFYLYFKDKDDLEEYLTTARSNELICDAISYANKNSNGNFEDRLINALDYIIDVFSKDKLLLNFIYKNFSFGVFCDRLTNIVEHSTVNVLEKFKNGIKKYNIKIENPEITLFMIVELTSSVVFTSIKSGKPLPIEELKPYLYKKIRVLLSN